MLIEELAAGELDVVGDVHGEIDSLQALLVALGYSDDGHHHEERRLVFVGDLVDRGPDSAGVVALVSRLVQAGRAQCVLGNHELNILRESRKPDNAWFFEATDARTQDEIMRFIAERTLGLERAGLRVVHACWHADSIAAARESDLGLMDLFREAEAAVSEALHAEGLTEAAAHEKSRVTVTNDKERPAMQHALGESEVRKQMGNPVKVLTSGIERVADEPFWANGKWRFTQRVPWWNDYDDESKVIVGHYWRSRHPDPSFVDEPGLFGDAGPTDPVGPAGRVMCIDYSIGRRSLERTQVGPSGPFRSSLAALRLRDGEPGEIMFSPV